MRKEAADYLRPGIGMTAEEVDKYINQIALSSANDFVDKYKDSTNAIIGHFDWVLLVVHGVEAGRYHH